MASQRNPSPRPADFVVTEIKKDGAGNLALYGLEQRAGGIQKLIPLTEYSTQLKAYVKKQKVGPLSSNVPLWLENGKYTRKQQMKEVAPSAEPETPRGRPTVQQGGPSGTARGASASSLPVVQVGRGKNVTGPGNLPTNTNVITISGKLDGQVVAVKIIIKASRQSDVCADAADSTRTYTFRHQNSGFMLLWKTASGKDRSILGFTWSEDRKFYAENPNSTPARLRTPSPSPARPVAQPTNASTAPMTSQHLNAQRPSVNGPGLWLDSTPPGNRQFTPLAINIKRRIASAVMVPNVNIAALLIRCGASEYAIFFPGASPYLEALLQISKSTGKSGKTNTFTLRPHSGLNPSGLHALEWTDNADKVIRGLSHIVWSEQRKAYTSTPDSKIADRPTASQSTGI